MFAHLIFAGQKLELIVDETVLGRLLLPERALLLQLRTPKRLNGMHRRPQLLVGEVQLLLESAQLPLQIRVLALQLSDEGLVGGGRLASRPGRPPI